MAIHAPIMGAQTRAPQFPGPKAPSEALETILAQLDRTAVEAAIETLIARLDAEDGDPDLEDDDPGGTALDDGEADFDRALLLPRYGVDQSLGPINEREVLAAHYRRMQS